MRNVNKKSNYILFCACYKRLKRSETIDVTLDQFILADNNLTMRFFNLHFYTFMKLVFVIIVYFIFILDIYDIYSKS